MLHLYKTAVITVSDRVANATFQDSAGPALVARLAQSAHIFSVSETKTVPDDEPCIRRAIVEVLDVHGADLVLTTGGTGFSPRDVTPEAVKSLLHRECPGLIIAMLNASLAATPFAALSRPVAGIRDKALIITLPGSPKAALENLEAIIAVLPHALDLMQGKPGAGEKVHREMQASHRHISHSPLPSPHFHAGTQDCALHGRSDALGQPVALRSRTSPFPMVPFSEALEIVLSNSPPLPPITLHVTPAIRNHVTTRDIFALEDVPGYRASVVDGYAMMSSDGPGTYRVVGSNSASASAPSFREHVDVTKGTLIRITTGAPVPPSADTVVMVEDTLLVESDPTTSQELLVQVLKTPPPNSNIRPIGSDLSKSTLVLPSSHILSATDISLLTTAGHTSVSVYRRPIVGIMSSGNELVDAHVSKLNHGQVRDSNRASLIGLAHELGFQVNDLGIVKDDPKSLKTTLLSALETCDVLISSGGVSMGEHDYMKRVLQHECNAQIHFGRVFMKPGKPSTFATIPADPSKSTARTKLIFALPGNPVSCLVAFHLLVKPSLASLSGPRQTPTPRLYAQLKAPHTLTDRPEFIRCRISFDSDSNTLTAETTGPQQSSRLMSCALSNGLACLPPATENLKEFEKGAKVSVILIGPLL